MIFEIENFINDEQLNYINKELDLFILSNEIGIKRNSYRDGKTVAISKEEKLKNLDKFLFDNVFGNEKLLSFIQRRYLHTEESGDEGYEFHRYGPGEVCHVHGDGELSGLTQTSGSEGLIRFLSIVLHLNTPKDGGDLVFPAFNKTIKTEAKKLVMFPPYNYVKHYTTESTTNRDVLVSWFVYKNIVARRI